MNWMKINKSLYFLSEGDQFFLFQIINLGNDDLKFIFTKKGSGTGGVYQSDGTQPSKNDIASIYWEYSYHHDGVLLLKHSQNGYINPQGNGIKRKPISKIWEFEPVLRYTVIDYDICKKRNPSDKVILPNNIGIFNGKSFECVILLGNTALKNLANNKGDEMIYRLNDVATNIDMVLWFYKSDNTGRIITVPNTQIKIFNTSNIIQVVERKPVN
jgi:hypothetical protein